MNKIHTRENFLIFNIFEQISDFDLDVTEVPNGCAFRISTRDFLNRKVDFFEKSTRAFVPYDCLSPALLIRGR